MFVVPTGEVPKEQPSPFPKKGDIGYICQFYKGELQSVGWIIEVKDSICMRSNGQYIIEFIDRNTKKAEYILNKLIGDE